MSNLSIYVRLGADVLTEQQMFYGYSAGFGFQFVITLATFLVGFCLAGLCRSIAVVPKDLTWPGVFGVTTLVTTLHGVGQKDTQARFVGIRPIISRLRLLLILAVGYIDTIRGRYPVMPSSVWYSASHSAGIGFQILYSLL